MPLWATGLLFSSLLTSCKEDLENTVPNSKVIEMPPDTNQRNAEEAYPGVTGIQKEGMLNGQRIKYLEKNGEAVWQGDIILSPEQLAGTSTNI